jgi:hypothetical protein
VAQIQPERPFNDMLLDLVVEYLQTRDPRIFPFTSVFDEHQRAAFARDLQEGLSRATARGSARKTSATGFIVNDQILQQVIEDWQAAAGQWPEGSFPQDPVTALGSSNRTDSPPPAVYIERITEDVEREGNS